MIKLATVFSGIGAIEHAIQRMAIPHEIVFACDNGDVDILSKDVKQEISHIEQEIEELDKLVFKIVHTKGNEVEYTDELMNNLFNIEENYKYFKENLNIDSQFIVFTKDVLSNLIENNNFNSNTIKTYKEWYKLLSNDQIDSTHRYIESIKALLKIETDCRRVHDKDFINGSVLEDSILKDKYIRMVDINKFKSIMKSVKEIADGLSMLHERINTFYITKELNKTESFIDKKKFVDKLYEGKEKQNKVRESYMTNYDMDSDHYYWNASFLDGRQYKDQVDLFVGGSPCQSFSLVGKQRGLEDTRGTLFYEYARLVSEIRPKVFIYENVKAVLSNDNGNTWKTMCDIFDDLDYTWDYKILNAKDFGIPQNRERLFVVGFRKDLNIDAFKFPEPIKLEKTMQDFLLDNVSGKYYLPKKGVAFVTDEKNLNKRFTQINGDIQLCQKKNQQFNWHGDFVFEELNENKVGLMDDLEKYFLSEKVKKYVLSSGTKGFYSKPRIDLNIARPLLTSMHKMHRAGVDNYVTTEGRIRKLAPRECLRLMGFCDSFKIVIADTPMYQQAGNSIVVDVLIKIMEEIINVYPAIIK